MEESAPQFDKILMKPKPGDGVPTTPLQSTPSLASNAVAFDPENALPNSYTNEILRLWQNPIDFYGKVEGEKGSSVGGALIQFQWSEAPEKSANRNASTESDSDGLFSLHGAKGPDLMVRVSKDGYYASGGQGFKYGAFGDGSYHPDPSNPVKFVLQKKGIPAKLSETKRNYQVPRDGTPLVINLINGKTKEANGQNLEVQCWTEDQGKRPGEKYDWKCVVRISGGGIVSTAEKYPFLAPETGYRDSFEIQFLADGSAWTDEAETMFYFRLANGNYGRMSFSMIAGGQHFCMVDAFINPTGSRDLEPGG